MIARPKELIGKWFNNVAGRPQDYYFVISSDFSAKGFPSRHFMTHHLLIKPKKIKVERLGWSNFSWWEEPVTDFITLNKLRHKAIKGILK